MHLGLSDEQLVEVFDILSKAPDAGAIYDKWIEGIDEQLIDLNPSVKSYTGVNTDDAHQRDVVLFPLLRFNMSVIDFWLSNMVFRREMKVFENKLIRTAWDLCSEQFEHVVTGFSGTNDTKSILPLPIAQNDLEELKSTNDKMLKVLRSEENRCYEALSANVTGNDILQRLTERKIPVLLDAGALIELNNKQVAVKWLELAPQYEAAVYFDSNILQTIDQNGIIAAYDCSVYRDNLTRCLVYLDDVHTRGTDLKFPPGCRAGVTLCGNIMRDKTVQACMRLRQLGKTHSVSFWASFEADIRIRELHKLSGEEQVTNEHVIDFICENSSRYERDNMGHWVAAGLNYIKKLIGHKLFESSQDEKSFDELYQWCVDDEFISLAEMYGGQQKASLKDSIETTMNKLALNAKMTDEIRELVNKFKCEMIKKLENQRHDLNKLTHGLHEEQEKELEEEPQEREVYRPGKCEPSIPPFNDIERLKKLVLSGAQDSLIAEMKSDGGLMSMADSLSHAGLHKSIEKDVITWSNHLLVTKDFKTVVKQTENCDEFLRPIWWIARMKSPKVAGKYFIILLSTFECEQLKRTFQRSTVSTLMMYRPPISKSHSNLIEIRALHVTGMTDDEDNCNLDVNDEIQIGIYSGMMYFHCEAELKPYCDFLGLILCPETEELAFKEGTIQSKGLELTESTMKLVKELIKAHHQLLPKDAHAASILLWLNKPDVE